MANYIVHCKDLNQLTELYRFYHIERESYRTWRQVMVIDDVCKGAWVHDADYKIEFEHIGFEEWHFIKKRGVTLAEKVGII